MRFIYSKEQLKFIETGFKKMRVPELTHAFNAEFNTNLRQSQIKSCIKNHKFKCGREHGLKKGEAIKLFNAEQIAFIKKQYPQHDHRTLTAMVNKQFNLSIKPQQLKAFVKNHKIKSGRTGQFHKGKIPWIAGKKGVTGPNSGSFKKGLNPHNLKPIGHERIENGYRLTKINQPDPYSPAKTRYKHTHIVVWEQHHGPIPPGHMLNFKDGNRLNCDINNLTLVTKQEHLLINRNGYRELPAEFKDTVFTLAKLQTKQHALENRRAKLAAKCKRPN